MNAIPARAFVTAAFAVAAAVAFVTMWGILRREDAGNSAVPPAVSLAGGMPDGEATPEAGQQEDRDEILRRLAVGVWEDDYRGRRTMTLREDGTGTMIVELNRIEAALFAPRLTFDMRWTVEEGRLRKQTIGGHPPDKIEFVVRMMGDLADEPILELTEQRLLVEDQNGSRTYDWRRVEPAEE